MDVSPILDPLNEAQRAAVTAPLGPVLVLAGAGSGKTRVLTHRIAWLIQAEGASPHGILAVTFTNKAAGEMRARVERLLGVPSGALWIGTFHGIAQRLLRAFELWRDNPSLLAHYRRRFQHVLVDEFQDTNAIQYEWIKQLAAPGPMAAPGQHAAPAPSAAAAAASFPFVVGDDDQCLAAGTLVTLADGSKRPIEAVSPGDLVMSSYGSGALRPAKVTERLARERSGRTLTLYMRSGRSICSTPEHTHFAGYLLGETPQTYFLYLMHKERVGWRLGTSQVYTNGQEKPMVGFKQRSAQEHADGTWIIPTHSTENDARLDEMLTSLRYGLPSLDTDSAALRLLEDVGLDPEQPHYRPRGRNSNRHNIVITLCADRRGASPMHRISVAGSCATVRRILEAQGLSVRAAKHNHRSWRL